MFRLMIECGRTGKLIATGIETDPVTFFTLPDVQAKAYCPHCNRFHLWTKADAVAQSLASAAMASRAA